MKTEERKIESNFFKWYEKKIDSTDDKPLTLEEMKLIRAYIRFKQSKIKGILNNGY
jgi:hypothetical protein